MTYHHCCLSYAHLLKPQTTNAFRFAICYCCCGFYSKTKNKKKRTHYMKRNLMPAFKKGNVFSVACFSVFLIPFFSYSSPYVIFSAYLLSIKFRPYFRSIFLNMFAHPLFVFPCFIDIAYEQPTQIIEIKHGRRTFSRMLIDRCHRRQQARWSWTKVLRCHPLCRQIRNRWYHKKCRRSSSAKWT